MKIVFLCGSLELGRDGVGDYTRRLAGELIKQGHQAAAIAFNDRFVVQTIKGVQQADCVNISVLRLPSLLSEKDRFKWATLFINEYNPDWLSLQFVPFSFHYRGIPFSLAKKLKALKKARNFHIMFHELWVGMDSNASFKLVWWGRVQKLLIKSLVAKLKPTIIHTQTKLYQLQLSKLGIDAAYLPLFSNIPVINTNQLKQFKAKKPKEGEKSISFVIFGNIQSGAPIKQFSKEVAEYALKNNIKFVLKVVGRCGAEQDQWIKAWEAEGLKAEVIGEQPPETVSVIFKQTSIGIATTPMALIEKSGAVAAMLEHGLKVICVSRAWIPRTSGALGMPEGVVRYTGGKFEACMLSKKAHSKNNLTRVSDLLVESLKLVFSKV